jgi:hypothetical protein
MLSGHDNNAATTAPQGDNEHARSCVQPICLQHNDISVQDERSLMDFNTLNSATKYPSILLLERLEHERQEFQPELGTGRPNGFPSRGFARSSPGAGAV